MRRERTGGEEDCSQRETGEAAAKSTHCGKQTRDHRQTAGPPVTHVCTRHRRPIYFCPRFRSGGNLISLWLSPFQTWRGPPVRRLAVTLPFTCAPGLRDLHHATAQGWGWRGWGGGEGGVCPKGGDGSVRGGRVDVVMCYTYRIVGEYHGLKIHAPD